MGAKDYMNRRRGGDFISLDELFTLIEKNNEGTSYRDAAWIVRDLLQRGDAPKLKLWDWTPELVDIPKRYAYYSDDVHPVFLQCVMELEYFIKTGVYSDFNPISSTDVEEEPPF